MSVYLIQDYLSSVKIVDSCFLIRLILLTNMSPLLEPGEWQSLARDESEKCDVCESRRRKVVPVDVEAIVLQKFMSFIYLYSFLLFSMI